MQEFKWFRHLSIFAGRHFREVDGTHPINLKPNNQLIVIQYSEKVDGKNAHSEQPNIPKC